MDNIDLSQEFNNPSQKGCDALRTGEEGQRHISVCILCSQGLLGAEIPGFVVGPA